MNYHIYTRVLFSLCTNASLGFYDDWRWLSFALRLSIDNFPFPIKESLMQQDAALIKPTICKCPYFTGAEKVINAFLITNYFCLEWPGSPRYSDNRASILVFAQLAHSLYLVDACSPVSISHFCWFWITKPHRGQTFNRSQQKSS